MQKVGIGASNTCAQIHRGLPAHAVQAAHVHQLAGRAVGLGGVPHHFAVKAHHLAHQLGQCLDAQVVPAAHVDQGRVHRQQAVKALIGQVHQVHAGVGHVVAVQKLAQRGASAPGGHGGVATLFGLVKLADQRRQHMAVLQVVVVARAIQVGGHGGQKAGAVLAVVGRAHLNACDLGQGVGAVGGLQRAGQQVLFAHGLGALAWVNAAAAQKQQALYAMAPCRVDHIGLNRQVVANELGWVAVVGHNAPHLGRGQVYLGGFFGSKKGLNLVSLGQVQFGMGAGQHGLALGLQPAHQGRAHQAAVACDVYFCVVRVSAHSLHTRVCWKH